MRRLRPVLFTLAFLLLVFFIGVGRYAYIRGLTSKWRGYVTKEFQKRGFEISLRRLTLDPIRGLVAREVVVYDAADRRRIVAAIDQMVLQVNYANFARGKMFLDALDLHSANLSLPIDPSRPRGQKVKVTQLNARLFFPQPESIQLASAEAHIFGVHVFATGRMINPQAFRSLVEERSAISSEWFAHVLSEIDALKYETDAPVLGLKFSGDLAHPEKISFDLDFWGERIRRRGRVIKSLYASIGCRDGVIDLRQLKATDAAGELLATGLWQPAAGKARLQAHSTIDALGLAHAFRVPLEPLNDYVFYTQPEVDLRAEWSFSNPPLTQVIGQITTGKFAYKSVVFERGSSAFSWNDGCWSARDIHLFHRTGEATGDLLQTPGEFRGQLKSTINPKDLQPLLSGVSVEMLTPLSFPKSPEIALDARGSEPTLEGIVVDGEMNLGPTAFRGAPSDSSASKVHYEDRLLTIEPFFAHPPDGNSGNLRFDFRSGRVRLD